MEDRARELPVEAKPASPELAGFDVVAFLRRRWGTLLVVTILVSGLVAARTLTEPPVYSAEATLFVRLGREFVYRPEVGNAQSPRGYSVAEMVNSEVEILTSRDLAEQVIREIGAGVLYPELFKEEGVDPAVAFERGVLKFRGAVEARPVLNSSVVRVSFTHVQPALCARAVNILVARFTDKHLEVHADARLSFLEEQLKQYEVALARAEEALLSFKTENEVYDLAEQRVLLLRRLAELGAERDAARFRIAELEGEARPLNGGDPRAGEGDRLPEQKPVLMAELSELERKLLELDLDPLAESVADARKRLLDLRLQESGLLRNFKETSRTVRSVRQEMETVKGLLGEWESRSAAAEQDQRRALVAQIERLTGEIAALHRAEVLREFAALQTRSAKIEEEIQGLGERLRRLDAHDITLRRLEREVTRGDATLQTHLAQVQEERFSEDLDREKRINVKVIESAVPPIEPSGLPRPLMLALGGFAGLVAGAAASVLVELVRPR
ncbi:MAG TPA: Wzz/FepE/Etk N-terminal domain-containing protein [Planctomycetota bacterium]|nr:Wzz/FepE/Etk N-terminal domain-containing protein [Planctomycetota bacterium]